MSVADLTLPEGVTVLTDWDAAVVSIAAPRVEVEPEEAEAPEVEGAEPEIIGAKAEKEAQKGEGKEEATTDEKRKSKE